MNEQTAQLLSDLAAKLGTTSEYLWGVLVKQAPLSATVDLIQYAVILLAAGWLYRMRGRAKKCLDDDLANAIPYGFAWFFVFVLLMIALLSIGNTVAGFFNPEYWALREILSAAKGK